MAPLQVRTHPTKGRALHAGQAFAPGQTMQAFAQPTLLVAARSQLARVCSHCLRPGQPRACSRCRAAAYCHEACQSAAWAAGHARECRALCRARLADRPAADLPTPVRALIQVLLRPDAEAALAALAARRPPGPCPDLEMMAAAAAAVAAREAAAPAAVELLCKVPPGIPTPRRPALPLMPSSDPDECLLQVRRPSRPGRSLSRVHTRHGKPLLRPQRHGPLRRPHRCSDG